MCGAQGVCYISVAVCCSVLQCVAVCCSVLQCVGHRECVIYPLLSRATTFPVPKQQHKLRVAEYLQKISVEFSFLWFVVSNT